ncbi:MAG: hypothetical protein ABFD07_18200 [Methanobacterium sp.]
MLSIGASAITGAVTGATVAVGVPAVIGMAGEGLMGAGLLTGSTTLFSAGISTTGASIALANTMAGASPVARAPVSRQSPQQIAAEYGIDPSGNPANQPYARPNNATTTAQRAFVQGQPCINCGQVADIMVANHRVPLVVEYYQNGSINTSYMQNLNAVEPQCPTCSATSGAYLSHFSKYVRNILFSK